MKKNNKDDKYKLFTNILNGIMMIFTFIIVIYLIQHKNYSRLSTDILIYVSVFVPVIFEKTKYRFTDKYKLIYSIFIFLGQFLGSVINLYDYLWGFDLFVHFLSGILTVVAANYILEISKFRNISGIVKFIYIVGFCSLVAILWEVIEFGIDMVFKMNMQHSIDTGVKDTMSDMIVALLGSISTYYIIEKRKVKNGFRRKYC